MAVRNFYDEGQTAVQFYIVNDVGKLPAEVRGRLYRPAAENCVKGTVLTGAVGRTKKPEV